MVSVPQHVEGWRGAAGLTLIELLIVVVIAAVIVAVAGPSVATSSRRHSVRVAADQFVATHAIARSSAMKYGRLAELHLDNSTGRIWVAVDTADSGTPDTIGIVTDLSRRYVRLTSSRSKVCFDASGSLSSRGTCGSGLSVIVFAAGGYADTVRITAAGSVLR